MAFFDFPIDELRRYLPERDEPADFETFWNQTLAEARGFALGVRFEPYPADFPLVDVFDVTFHGFGGQSIKGWFLFPAKSDKPLPCVVEYIGYGGGRNYPANWLVYPAMGFATFVMDNRGQGSTWSHGDTPDNEPAGSNPQHPGFMTRGILDPKNYYYRRLITDAVRAVEAARSHPLVNPNRIFVTGGSQGGGLALAVAGLDTTIFACLPDVPFLCHFRRAVTLVDSDPYNEIARFAKAQRDKVDQIWRTLSYFDGMHFASRATMPGLFSVGLMDEICPPSTVFAAYNHYAGEKQIKVYEFNQHDGGGEHHLQEQMRFIRSLV